MLRRGFLLAPSAPPPPTFPPLSPPLLDPGLSRPATNSQGVEGTSGAWRWAEEEGKKLETVYAGSTGSALCGGLWEEKRRGFSIHIKKSRELGF